MNINGYLDYIKTPWGRLFYRLVWHNLKLEDKKILNKYIKNGEDLNTSPDVFWTV